MKKLSEMFCIKDRVCIITGGAGLLGRVFAAAISESGGIPVLLDISQEALNDAENALKKEFGSETVVYGFCCNITSSEQITSIKNELLDRFGKIDVLINNAANNPKVESSTNNEYSDGFTSMSVNVWNDDLAVGLTGAFLCSQIFGEVMEKHDSGVIVNISSDYGIIAPDQRVYRDNNSNGKLFVKPISYSVVKHGIIGMTKYLAAYWGKNGIRVNTLCPASISNGQADGFTRRISELIPLGRMSYSDEYKAAILFLISDASSYMTGSTLLLDGGRTII